MSARAATEQARAVRRGAGLFALAHRGVIEVRGADRVRWLNGMVSNDVASLAPGGARSGCPALLLNAKGGIVADLHVIARDEALWLDLERSALPGVIERLRRYVIADDVTLVDLGEAVARLALEGPAAPAVLAAAGARVAPGHGSAAACTIAGVAGLAAAFGFSGEPAFQLFFPHAEGARVEAALDAAGRAAGGVRGSEEALEILRIEAGRPRLGRELGEDVLPPEARLEHAISYTKGCYTGQEIVARLRSRGQVHHLLVGLLVDGAPPAPGAAIEAAGAAVGSVTSAALSPVLGAIALGFVRRPHDAPGGAVRVGGAAARVAALPLAGPGAATT